MAGLDALSPRYAFRVAVVDVDSDPALAARFGRDVPVLAHGERELCRHRFDAAELGAYLSGFRSER